jgi:hypothetical protein
MHPLRMQRWAISDLNPWLAALGPAAEAVRANRLALPATSPTRRIERYLSDILSASLDYYRELRDAASEAAFFQLYGNVLAVEGAAAPAAPSPTPVREAAFAKRVLANLSTGGYPEAVARVAALLARTGEPIPLARLDLKRELVRKYDDLLPRGTGAEWRRVRGEQEVAVQLEPEKALASLGDLLPKAQDRARLASLLDHMIEEGRAHGVTPTAEQESMLARVRGILFPGGTARLRGPASRKRRKAVT